LELLLDTHVFLWWESDAPDLSAVARRAIADPANQVFVSAASMWEIATKRRNGKLVCSGSPTIAIGRNGFHELPIWPIDAELAGDLSWPHRDPFDRLLIAQAIRLQAALVTFNAAIRTFEPVVTLWAG
jgi:PIN domain nuclease of toxin-antitoxin system